MFKFELKIYIFCFLFPLYIFPLYNNSQKDNLTQLPIKKYNSPKILQTLYSDSPSNNYYYAVLYMGRNFTRQTYLIDTEIDVLSSPCHRCYFCGGNKTNYFYNSRFVKRRIMCDWELCNMLPSIGCIRPQEYIKTKQCAFLSAKLNGDGMRGYFIKEFVFFERDIIPTNKSANKVYGSHFIPIGCSLAEFGNYKTIEVDGIMGLNNKEKSFINMLYDLKIIKNNIFSICLGDRFGYLSLGSIYKRFHKSRKIAFIPFISDSTYSYQIKVTDIKIDRIKVGKIETNCSIDSTIPVSYFPIKIFQLILNTCNHYFNTKKKKVNIFKYNKNYGYCTDFQNKEKMNNKIKIWPNIYLSFYQTSFTWKPENYFYRASDTKACFGIRNHSFEHIIFGNNFMRGKDFIFDRTRNRIGIVDADCSKIITKNHFDNRNDRTNTTFDDTIYQEKRNRRILTIRNGVEFLRDRNNELENAREYNLFNRIVHISFVGLIILMTCLISVILLILYYIIYPKDQEKNCLDNENKKLSQYPNE